MGLNTDVGREGLAHKFQCNSSQRCSVGLRRSGLCAGQSSFSTANSLIHVFMDLTLRTCAQFCFNRKGPSSNCSHKVRSMKLSKMSCYDEALRVLFTGTKGLSPAPEKQPHTIISPPLHMTQCSLKSTVLLATAKPRLVHRISSHRSVIRHSRESSGSML